MWSTHIAQFFAAENLFPSSFKYSPDTSLIDGFFIPNPDSIAGKITVWNGILSLP